MSGEFFDHRESIDRTFGSVMQKVQVNQATVEPPVRHWQVSLAKWDGIDGRPHRFIDAVAGISSTVLKYAFRSCRAMVCQNVLDIERSRSSNGVAQRGNSRAYKFDAAIR